MIVLIFTDYLLLICFMIWQVKIIYKSKVEIDQLWPTGQIYLFLHDLWAKNRFYIFRSLKKGVIFCDVGQMI